MTQIFRMKADAQVRVGHHKFKKWASRLSSRLMRSNSRYGPGPATIPSLTHVTRTEADFLKRELVIVVSQIVI